jgi:L-asparaginase II
VLGAPQHHRKADDDRLSAPAVFSQIRAVADLHSLIACCENFEVTAASRRAAKIVEALQESIERIEDL